MIDPLILVFLCMVGSLSLGVLLALDLRTKWKAYR